MFVSSPFLFVLLCLALLFLGKHFACRSFYREVQQPYRAFGWHNDPSRPDPRLELESDLQVWSSTAGCKETAEKQRIS